ncbi:Uncharacterized protein AC499_0548 [Pseudomonas amygdali pv. lachrymans]|uniref:Uncharacterized protein n=1 Tax=Pseudomonas amygdali pv. lachrymans TaxID=53707 RepID=A0ABR5KRA5_PSEAV|nr:Uncharacterized protein AC499_0548 [Pseudomonas amygdali pv. lachrymans]
MIFSKSGLNVGKPHIPTNALRLHPIGMQANWVHCAIKNSLAEAIHIFS